MAFLTGFLIGFVVTAVVVKVSLKTGDQGNFRYCDGCPYKFPDLDNDVEGDVIEESAVSVGNHTDTIG